MAATYHLVLNAVSIVKNGVGVSLWFHWMDVFAIHSMHQAIE